MDEPTTHLSEEPLQPSDTPKKPRRQYRKWFGAERKLERIRKIRADAEARRKALDDERKQARARARAAEKAAQNALKRALKAQQTMPDPEDTPERQAQRKADRRARGANKGQPTLPGRQRNGSLTAEDVALILALKEKAATNLEIAKVLNLGADTVARALAEFADTRPLAKAYLRSQADTLAHHAVTASSKASMKGDAEPALELLDRLDIAPKRLEDSDKSKVMIIVGGQDVSALPALPLLDATTVE